ncbi:MAG: DNA primase [Alphaproteobacteria bacterium]|nr:DNA primase [Alphaproteobacteria bacterium]
MAFSENLVDAIHEKILLSDFIGRKVSLVKKGNDFLGLCPFHNEKTPSFSVSDEKGFFHCFGCSAHGDVISFVMQKESIDFKEALKLLASEAGINLLDYAGYKNKISKESIDAHNLVEFSKDYFVNNLNASSGISVRDYLSQRKVSEKAYKYFELGYAENISNNLIMFLKNNNFSMDAIIASGLARNSIKNHKPYDFFRNRLIFPIHDNNGTVIAFGGRGLEGSEPKYLNSPDTILFKKKKMLFNFHRAKKYVQKHKLPLIVVEGYFDVISLYHIGLYGAVAPLGTALSEDQLILMWRIADEPIICMDGDKAGYRSAIRTLNIAMNILKPGKSLRFVFLPDGEDPDSLVLNSNKEHLINIINNPISMFDFFWKSETENIDMKTPERRAGFKLLMEKKISLIKDLNVRAEYKNSLYTYFNKNIRNSSMFNNKSQNKTNFNVINIELDKLNADRVNKKMYVNFREKYLIESILNNPDLLEKIDEEFSMLVFSNNELGLIRTALIDLYKKNGTLSNADIIRLKEDINYSKIFMSIFKLNDWTKTKFTPDYVKKHDDLNYVEKCWVEAANLQKTWYRKKRN